MGVVVSNIAYTDTSNWVEREDLHLWQPGSIEQCPTQTLHEVHVHIVEVLPSLTVERSERSISTE